MQHHDFHPVFSEFIGLTGCVPRFIWEFKKEKHGV